MRNSGQGLPTITNRPAADELEKVFHNARKFDVAARDERNLALGNAGVERIVEQECDTLSAVRRENLERHFRWFLEEDGDGASRVVAGFPAGARQRMINIETMKGWECAGLKSRAMCSRRQMSDEKSVTCLACRTSPVRPKRSIRAHRPTGMSR